MDVEPSSVPPSIPLTRISPTNVLSEASSQPAPITIGQIIQDTAASRNHLLGYPSSGVSRQQPGLEDHQHVRPSVIPDPYSESSNIRTETINTDQNSNTQSPSSLGLHLDGVPGSSRVSAAGQFEETPRSPDSVRSAFQKTIQDTLISTAERQLESFRNQNHLQFRKIQNSTSTRVVNSRDPTRVPAKNKEQTPQNKNFMAKNAHTDTLDPTGARTKRCVDPW